MERWEKLNLDLKYFFKDDAKLVNINTNKAMENIIEEIDFILEKSLFK